MKNDLYVRLSSVKCLGVLFGLMIFTLLGCESQQSQSKHPYTNDLINESSPYLLQHAHNPVNWYPWGDEALAKAEEEGKLMIISVGYSACHWCHVMEHESFEDDSVAAYMNEHFVAIKVDREERPDVDDVYMDACQITNESCGWPLNAIALPDGRPIYTATYLPKNEWLSRLNQLLDAYQNRRKEVEEFANQLTQGIQTYELVERNTAATAFHQDSLPKMLASMQAQQDMKLGGRMGAPKFPSPAVYEYLIRYHYYTQSPEALEMLTTTLDAMASGGIYDHLGGGFARYSTDAQWHIPHFEKMLYDNAQLIGLYAQAYQLTKDPIYQARVTESMDFIQREMTHKSGGFYSALDADSEGEEGKFYVWKAKEIQEALGDDAAVFMTYYDVKEAGNWEEEKNVLRRMRAAKEIAEAFDLSEADLANQIEQAKKKLLKTRAKRIRPGLDDKVIAAWNGLMLKAAVQAYQATQNESFLQLAKQNADFLQNEMIGSNGQINRIWKDGKSSINGFLDDYAMVADGMIALYQVTFDESYLNTAKQLTDYARQNFMDASSQMFFSKSKEDEQLIARKMNTSDNVIPSANAVMARNLLVLGTYWDEASYRSQALQMMQNLQVEIQKAPRYYAHWAATQLHYIYPAYEIAIVGDNWQSQVQQMQTNFLPDAFYLGGKTEGSLPLLENKLIEGQTTIFVCQKKVCKLPVTEVDAALELMER